MPSYDNMEDLIEEVKKEAMKILKKEVYNMVVDKAIEHAIEDVYNVYTPIPVDEGGYKRKYTLKRKNNYQKIIGDNNITIKSTSTHDGKDITKVVETGVGYDYRFPYYDVPRPFIENTKLDIEEKNLHVKAMKEGLVTKGFEVETE